MTGSVLLLAVRVAHELGWGHPALTLRTLWQQKEILFGSEYNLRAAVANVHSCGVGFKGLHLAFRITGIKLERANILPMHFAPCELYDWGWITPTQSPKHSCWTLNDVGSPRGGDTAPPPLGDEGAAAEGAGETGGAALSGGEPELWRSLLPGSDTRREQSLSASDLVISPHWAAEIGSTRASLRAASWAGLQVEQKICSSSQA